jgi:quercetin dioxygenase-like cupin family protein
VASQIRRVVTGHDEIGRAVVKIDGELDLIARPPVARAQVSARVLWTTESFPVDNAGDVDTAQRETGLTLANGTVFRVVEFGPGNAPRIHRTDSIDYAVVISGEIDMELDDSVVHLKAGDVLVQRGTIHNWVNKGTEPCRIAFILIDATPVTAGGKVLHAVG